MSGEGLKDPSRAASGGSGGEDAIFTKNFAKSSFLGPILIAFEVKFDQNFFRGGVGST